MAFIQYATCIANADSSQTLEATRQSVWNTKIQPMPEPTTGREKQLVEISIAIICQGGKACLSIEW